jgi:simple sugar transport system substrate-binding protein
MVAVANLEWNGAKIEDGTEIPGLGKAIVDREKRIISVNRMLDITKQSVDGLIAQGL